MGQTNKHIILDHLAKSKGLRRKDLVTFICINNGYEGHKRGYYGTAIQQWEYEGYIKKKGNKWYIDNLGKRYLTKPKEATLQASINVLRKKLDRYKGYYHEAQHNADQYRIEYKEAMREHDEAIEEIWRLKGELATQKRTLRSVLDNEEVVDESDIVFTNSVMDELNNEISSLKTSNAQMESEANKWLNLYQEVRDKLVALQDKQPIAPNTLVKMPPPSTDYSEFSKAELIGIIKRML